MDTTPEPVILVGVDGSEASKEALAWAADEARKRAAVVECLISWTWPTSYGWTVTLPDDIDPAADAQRVLDEALAPVREAYPDLTFRTEVVEGPPAPSLVDASAHADLLVVGSRGHGEFAGMLLGSVSAHCTAHAHCSVVVHRLRKARKDDKRAEP
jgi:nucleotide-binding universal stress UspA family protein